MNSRLLVPASIALLAIAGAANAQERPRPHDRQAPPREAQRDSAPAERPLRGPRMHRADPADPAQEATLRDRIAQMPADVLAEWATRTLSSPRADQSVRLDAEQRRRLAQAIETTRRAQAAYYAGRKADIVEAMREGGMDGLADRLADERIGGEQLARMVPRLVLAGTRPMHAAAPATTPDGVASDRRPMPDAQRGMDRAERPPAPTRRFEGRRPAERLERGSGPGERRGDPRREGAREDRESPRGGRFDREAFERGRQDRLPAIQKLAAIAREAPGQAELRRTLAETLSDDQRRFLREQWTAGQRGEAGASDRPGLRIPPRGAQRPHRLDRRGEPKPAPSVDDVRVPPPGR